MMIRSLTWMLPAALVVAPAAAVVRPAPDGQVTAVSLSSQGGTAQLAIAVTGPVTVKDFTLTDPARLVLDLEGASLADLQSYDGQRRGSVRAVRVRAQDGNVVRVVLEFDRLPTYRTAQVDGMITVAFADEAFAAWSTGGAKGLAVAPATLPTPQPAEAVPAAVTRERALNQLASGTLVGMNRSFGSKDDERISVSFNRATMQEVATVFSRYSGRSILVGPGTFPGAFANTLRASL